MVCSADSDTHGKAIADVIRDGMELKGISVWHSEGFQARQWILLDYVDVVVHVFHKSLRSFYNLERLWSDAKIHLVEDRGATVAILPPTKTKQTRAKAKRPVRRTSASL